MASIIISTAIRFPEMDAIIESLNPTNRDNDPPIIKHHVASANPTITYVYFPKLYSLSLPKTGSTSN